MKNLKTRKLEKAKKQRLKELNKEFEELVTRAKDLIVEYIDVEDLELNEIAEELAQIKKRYYENWLEASELELGSM